MKRLAASAAALIFLATAAPVLAQDRDRGYNNDRDSGWNQRDDRDRYNRDRDNRDRDNRDRDNRDRDNRNRDNNNWDNRDHDRYNRDYYRDRSGHEWHQGDTWQGHRLTYYNGRWGYWEPRNGTQFFVQFSL